MALAVLNSRGLTGMDAPPVTVEVHIAPGLPGFQIVGLPEAEVKESKDRVRAAIQTSRFEFPARRITVNLAPADLPKESGRFDLPIALGVLAAMGQVPQTQFPAYEFAGELAFTGALRPIRGALAMTYKAHQDGRSFMIPIDNAPEAALVRSAVVYPAESLLAVCAHLTGRALIAPYQPVEMTTEDRYADLLDIKAQATAKRVLEIAAAGQHSLLMVGPPGTGKSMLAMRLPGILPPMTEAEALEAAAIHSLYREFQVEKWRQRPFRNPHHTASGVALVGGGGIPRPGEISLAHNGVLFLDELPEFSRAVLEVLREPLESGRVHISRAARQAEFPARFQLVAAMNPCPCGYFGHYSNKCHCTPDQISRYRGKISGPFLDRIDLHLEVPSLHPDELLHPPQGESSPVVRQRVIVAQQRQLERQQKANVLLAGAELTQYCALDAMATQLLQQAIHKLNLSARAYGRILKVARTIADLAGARDIAMTHLAEAIQYRRWG